MARALVVIPTYNERENIAAAIDAVLEVVARADVLVVDDASPDGTADLVEERFAGFPNVSVLRRSGPRGLGNAYRDAFQHALAQGYARIVQMDADLSHNPRCLPALLDAARTHDVVIGSRYMPGGGAWRWPLRRRLLSRFANLYLHALTGLPVTDATSGFRCWTRAALERVGLESVMAQGYAFQVEMTWRAVEANLSIAELPIVFGDRERGQSKMTPGVILESAVLPFRLRALSRQRPARSSAAPRSKPKPAPAPPG